MQTLFKPKSCHFTPNKFGKSISRYAGRALAKTACSPCNTADLWSKLCPSKVGQDFTQAQSQQRSEWLDSLKACCLPLVGKKPSISSIITLSPPKHVSQVHFLPKLSYRKIPFFLSSAETVTLVTKNPCVGVVCACKGSRWSQAEKSGI